MRRKDREITGRENIEPILRACKTCRVAMIADGAPYVVPLNFGYTWDDDGLTLYFHSGLKGKKIDALRADPRVCFELDTEQGVTGEGDIASGLPVQLRVFLHRRLRQHGVRENAR